MSRNTETKNASIDNQYGFTDLTGAASILGLSKSKIYKACSEKIIPHYKPCGKLFFKVSELLTWIVEGKQ